MKTLLRLSAAFLAFSTLVPTASGAAKAIPSTYVRGNLMPFGDATGNGTYQQVYDASLFPGKLTIRSISFVPEDFGLPGFFAGKYEVSFSVTPKVVCGLDGNDLSQNIGSNNNVFFKGKLDGGVTIRGRAYTYDPVQGNLLMTIKVTGKPAPDFNVLQAAMMRGNDCDGSSRAYYFPEEPAAGADNIGLVTIFVYVPVIGSSSPQAQAVRAPGASHPAVLVVGDVNDGSVVRTPQ